MPVFKFVVADTKSRKSFQVEVDQAKARGVIGKKIKDEIPGDIVGLAGYALEVTGGSDRDGFPMRGDVAGAGRKKIILSSPQGFHPKVKGQRKRKCVCGNVVSENISQINVKVMKYGSKSVEELLGKTKTEETAEKKEEKKEIKAKEPDKK